MRQQAKIHPSISLSLDGVQSSVCATKLASLTWSPMLRSLRPTRRGTRVGATYVLPSEAITPQEREQIKKALTVQAKMTFGAPPPPFLAWREEADGTLHAPRFYGLEHFGLAETDDRVLGEEVRLSFEGELTPVQKRATEVIFGRQLAEHGVGGVTNSLPCGYGKTVWAVAAIARLGRKACVLVHKTVLLDQWRAAFERFCPGARVGVLQGDKCELEGTDVVLAMVLTVAKRGYDPSVMDCFGTVVCDEAHHMGSARHEHGHAVVSGALRHRPDGHARAAGRPRVPPRLVVGRGGGSRWNATARACACPWPRTRTAGASAWTVLASPCWPSCSTS